MDAHSYKGFIADIYLSKEQAGAFRSSYVIRGDVPPRQHRCAEEPAAKEAALLAAKIQFAKSH